MGYSDWFGQASGFKCSANKNLVDGEEDARDPWPAAATQLRYLWLLRCKLKQVAREPKYVQAITWTTTAVWIGSLYGTHWGLTEAQWQTQVSQALRVSLRTREFTSQTQRLSYFLSAEATMVKKIKQKSSIQTHSLTKCLVCSQGIDWKRRERWHLEWRHLVISR